MSSTVSTKLDEIRERWDPVHGKAVSPIATSDVIRQNHALRAAVDGLILESCQFCPRCKGAKTDDFETCSASATIQQIAAIMNGEE